MNEEGFKYENEDGVLSNHVMRRFVYEIAKEESLKGATGLATGVKNKNPSGQKSLVDQFIQECCSVQEGTKVLARQLYDAFCDWSKLKGRKSLTKRDFGNQMSKKGEFKRGRTTNGQRAWIGLMITQNPKRSRSKKN